MPTVVFWSWNLQEQSVNRKVSLEIWEKGFLTIIFDQDTKNSMAITALESLLAQIDNLSKIRKRGIKAGKKLVEHTKLFSKQKSLPLGDYLNYLKEMRILYQDLIRKSMNYWLLTADEIEERLIPFLSKYSSQEREEIFEVMSLPTSPSYSQIEEKFFHAVVRVAQKHGLDSPHLKKAIKNFSEKYFWFPFEYVGPKVWDEKAVEKRVSESLREEKFQEFDDRIKEKQKRCIKKHHLPQKVVDLFKVMQLITLMQDDRKRANSEMCYYFIRDILMPMAKRLHLSKKEAFLLDENLLDEFVKNGTEMKKELGARANIVALVHNRDEHQLYSGKKARQKLKELGVPYGEENEEREIKGRVANKGKAKGIARIIYTSSNVHKFNKRDIIVTPMTTPDFVPFIKKASAIVTDEGGITSHAAIISRELNIPCIVGTNSATSLIKDGDLIEVDAFKGIVKKI